MKFYLDYHDLDKSAWEVSILLRINRLLLNAWIMGYNVFCKRD